VPYAARNSRLADGLDPINDGLNEIQLRKSYSAFMDMQTRVGLRGLMGHVLGFTTMMRGGNQRRLLLSDLSSRLVPAEESSNATTVIFGLDGTKTDKDHKIDYVGIIRNKDVLSCGVFFIALFLFSQ
jgi:hypothetical protein